MAMKPTEGDIDTRVRAAGWELVDPEATSRDVDGYRRFIQESRGEFTVAKDIYVRPRSGWFSDRSACYLAAGRPVITQQTGFTDHYGNQGGLFAFKSLGEIAAAVRAINADYKKHSCAARAVACEIFEAEKVVGQILERAGV
jgi:glycosyltransferase involved in cell wall biosynthesis